jgi:hypothetical protein
VEYIHCDSACAQRNQHALESDKAHVKSRTPRAKLEGKPQAALHLADDYRLSLVVFDCILLAIDYRIVALLTAS